MSGCTHRTVVLGKTLYDASNLAKDLGLEDPSLVSFRNIDLVRGMTYRDFKYTGAALLDPRFADAVDVIEPALWAHASCDCDGQHDNCRGCGTALPWAPEPDEWDDFDPQALTRFVAATVVLAILTLVLIAAGAGAVR